MIKCDGRTLEVQCLLPCSPVGARPFLASSQVRRGASSQVHRVNTCHVSRFSGLVVVGLYKRGSLHHLAGRLFDFDARKWSCQLYMRGHVCSHGVITCHSLVENKARLSVPVRVFWLHCICDDYVPLFIICSIVGRFLYFCS